VRIYPATREDAVRLKEDYEFLGYTAFIEGDALVIVTHQKKKKKEKRGPAKKVDRRRDS
jgi:hypothetical protein